jgi:superfamily II DNA helicase RecQ
MPFRTLFIPGLRPSDADADLNDFLSKHKIVSIEKHWVQSGEQIGWCFCVEYSSPRQNAESPRREVLSNRPDMRTRLSPEDFRIYCRLKEWRLALSTKQVVAPYLVFTNEQLAQAIEMRATSREDLAKIAGVGDSRIENYGDQLLGELRDARGGAGEASRRSV